MERHEQHLSTENFKNFRELQLGIFLGIGTDSVVYEARDLENNTYAIKRPRNAKKQRFIENEANLLRYLNSHDSEENQAIVKIQGTCVIDGLKSLVLERNQCSLRQRLKQTSFSVQETRSIASRLISGFEFLKERGVVHGDIRPDNILINTREMVQIADFGGAFQKGVKRRVQIRECRVYLSPERILDEGACDFPSDLWSLAAVLTEVAAQKLLFPFFKSKEATEESREDALSPFIASHEIRMGLSYPESILSKSTAKSLNTYHQSQKLKNRKQFQAIKPLEETISPPFLEINVGKEEELQTFISMLRKMLDFDPERRIAISSLLEEDFFIKA